MIEFKRGTTPTFRFELSVPVSQLGTPRCVIQQEDFIAHLKTSVDAETNTLECTLAEEDSVLLVGDFPAFIQHSWVDELGNVVAFPTEEVFVEDAYIPIEENDELEDLLDDEIQDEDVEDIPEDEEDLMGDTDEGDSDDDSDEEFDAVDPEEEDDEDDLDEEE